ncbi:helix-turn-helix domain-containing protein [Arthrobacter zhangbolii]|uniref:Helix-turn-helix domain-containing protein n=1 Tax=Arthrobacter zhangbolii TaxID=2886936 RepID=A0A9X1M6J9_9MICC|nr:sugar diacid recognition domain-containing protein [Arthrobacter zhangbolii]MCC3272334.1 helix-turn-helix domain-containing protein [Arthrobacter zhangbolii]UON91803.1 helix-turn-helix domain-containing protein [Arthrobacter zhangbolii]
MSAPLSSALAQRVVDRISPTLQHNVNVMDAAGIIIASRDAARIGSLHAGAREAAATGNPVVIRRPGEQDGMRAGVNCPITLEGTVVGVVGLTGPPDVVLPLADVVVLTIRLLLEREREMDAKALREALDRDLLGRLLNGGFEPGSVQRALAGGSPSLPGPWRIAAVLARAEDGRPIHRLPVDAGKLTDFLSRSGRYRWASFQGALWILLDAHDDAALAAAAGRSSVLLLGDACSADGPLHESAATLGQLAARPELLPADEAVLGLQDLSAELAVACMPSGSARHLAARIAELSESQRSTLAAFLGTGSSISETSRRLFTHRNTVIQRLERIAQVTALNPRDVRHALTLQLALVATRA